MKNQKMPLKKHFKQAVKYLNESRNYVFFIVLLFLISVIFGYVYDYKFLFFNELIQKLVLEIQGKNLFEITIFILQNNLFSCFLGLFLGVFFAFIPAVICVVNGLLIGFVIKKVVFLTSFVELWKLLPHGIFELPAVFISLGLGIKLGAFIISKDPFFVLKQRIYESANVFLLIVFPLIVLAAIIESVLIFLF
jgi:stage II sporulation protein M